MKPMRSMGMLGVLSALFGGVGPVGAFDVMMTGDPNAQHRPTSKVILNSSHEVKEVIPAGCRKYFFNDNGCFRMLSSDGSLTGKQEDIGYIVYTCVAANEKSAKAKFRKNHVPLNA